MSSTVKFGYRLLRSDGQWRTQRYPHGGAPGADRAAVTVLRAGQRRDASIGLTARNAEALAQSVTDSGRITAAERPVLRVAKFAAAGRIVQVTDKDDVWCDLTATPAGAARFLRALKGKRTAATPGTPAPATGPRASDVVASLKGPLDGLSRWHESGDNGVDTRVLKLAGAASAQAALDAVLTQVSGGAGGTLLPLSGTDALDGFKSNATADLEQFRSTFYDTDPPPAVDENTDAMAAFAAAVTSSFAALKDVRAASGNSGEAYLLGRARDGYVAVVVWPYRDG